MNVGKWLLIVTLSAGLSIGAFAHEEQGAIEYLKSRPTARANGNYANTWDVAKCTALAEAVAVFVWYGKPILKKVGSSSEWAHVKLTALLESEKAAKGLEIILLMTTGYNINSVYNMTLGTFWDYTAGPAIDSCKRIGFDFWEGAKAIPVLLSKPDFYTPRSNDSPGVRNGRFCAEYNLGWTKWDWFGGGMDGCKNCCERKVNEHNGLFRYQHSCKAVCNAQFG